MQSPMKVPSVFLNIVNVKKVLCFLLPTLLLLSIAAYAGKECWEIKPFDEWTQKECQKLLENSPWAKELNLAGAQAIGYSGGNDAMDNQQPYVKYIIQLQSAQPIRQAIVRQMQIIEKYASMSNEQKQDFNVRNRPFLEGNFDEAVVVNISFSSNNREHIRNLLNHWQRQTADLLKNSVYLSGSKSEKVKIAQFIPVQGAQQEFKFVFPRKVNGKEILSPEDKTLRLEFTYPVIGNMGDGRGFIEFKIEKMKINDETIY
jgi:hypothetical protein